jgi:nitrate/nitrite-specific signal transduction histidine kinase
VTILLITKWLRPLKKIRQVATEISLGDFNQRITDLPNDELGDLAESFNKMTDSLVNAKHNVEEQVKTRTTELTKLNQFLVGRELKMADLKKQLKDIADEKK